MACNQNAPRIQNLAWLSEGRKFWLVMNRSALVKRSDGRDCARTGYSDREYPSSKFACRLILGLCCGDRRHRQEKTKQSEQRAKHLRSPIVFRCLFLNLRYGGTPHRTFYFRAQ